MQYLGISGLVAEKSEGQRDSHHLVSSGVQAGALRRCRARYIENALRRKRALAVDRASYLTEFFRLRPCVDCVETDPLVLELDRRESKLFTISKGLRDHNWQAVIDELAKCDVVCANCHRRRTARRGGFARAVVAQR